MRAVHFLTILFIFLLSLFSFPHSGRADAPGVKIARVKVVVIPNAVNFKAAKSKKGLCILPTKNAPKGRLILTKSFCRAVKKAGFGVISEKRRRDGSIKQVVVVMTPEGAMLTDHLPHEPYEVGFSSDLTQRGRKVRVSPILEAQGPSTPMLQLVKQELNFGQDFVIEITNPGEATVTLYLGSHNKKERAREHRLARKINKENRRVAVTDAGVGFLTSATHTTGE